MEIVMDHVLKVWPEFFKPIWDGDKTFEIREVRDRVFSVGDTLRLCEYSPDPISPTVGLGLSSASYVDHGVYSGREVWTQVTYVMTGMGLKDGYVAIGMKTIGGTKRI